MQNHNSCKTLTLDSLSVNFFPHSFISLQRISLILFAEMRHQWRLLHLLRSHNHHHLHALRSSPSPSIPRFTTTAKSIPSIPIFLRTFSSEPVLAQQQADSDSHLLVISEVFSKPRDVNDVKSRLDLNRVSINHDAINGILAKLDSNADVARRFFRWVLEADPQRLSSKSYNLMLRVLGTNGFTEEFWELVNEMKKKGYGVSKNVQDRVLEYFEKNGKKDDASKLKCLFDNGSLSSNSSEKIWLRVCKIVKHNVWSDDVEKQIRELNMEFSGERVNLIIEKLGGEEPNKALIFFRWLEESELYKHDGSSYNFMARALGREDMIDRFWKLISEMKSAGFEMEDETFCKVLGRFCKRRMMKDAVELYEFAMAGEKNNKPSPECCTFLLRKVVSNKELDMNLFSRVVKVFTENGNVLTYSMVDSVLRSLTSVGRIKEWNKVLKELECYGFVARSNLQSKIAYRLSASGNKEEAGDFVNGVEASGSAERKTWGSLIEGHCVAGNLDKAFDSLKEFVDKEGVSSAGYAFDVLVNSYCQMKKAKDASNILSKLVNEKGLKPWHSTYKLLITKLLAQGGFEDALNILGLMRNQGYPPFTDPILDHISKSGSGDDAVLFLKAMTSKRFPSTSVVLRMFDAFFKRGRHEEAQNCLSKCPQYIRNHADVLNLFCSMNSKEGAASSGRDV
ncbi:pentatricopeptide repeat-containing protein At3g02490, mitochondrial [Arachis ipaensis]|nr:pentatricopeptide repeat-containing protein At3g02490, mitochondrial [Arachis ipaensis]